MSINQISCDCATAQPSYLLNFLILLLLSLKIIIIIIIII